MNGVGDYNNTVWGGVGFEANSNMLGGHRGVISGHTNILGCHMDGVGWHSNMLGDHRDGIRC